MMGRTCTRRAGMSHGGKGGMMDARINVITLAVADLDRALAFYRDGLGFQTQGIIGTEWVGDDSTPAGATVTFELRGGLFLALYPRTELAKDAKVALGS